MFCYYYLIIIGFFPLEGGFFELIVTGGLNFLEMSHGRAPYIYLSKTSHLGAVIPLCHASSASIGTVVIAYVYHDASPDTLA